jgi:hypothetical protein
MITNDKQTNTNVAAAVVAILDAITQSVAAAGKFGAPAGVLYAALMAYGCNMQQFEAFMSYLVKRGKVTRRGNLYFSGGKESAI